MKNSQSLIADREKAFFHWLSSQVTDKQLSDLYMALPSINEYGRKRNRFDQSLFEITEYDTINWSAMIDFTSLGDDYSNVEDLRQAIEAGDLSAIQTTAAVIKQKGYGLINNLETFKNWIADIIDGNHLEKSGIFFIWDEFTEYVEHSDDHTVMQQLSEYCKVKPLFMLFIVHRSEQMVDSMGKERYQTITHRFHQLLGCRSGNASYVQSRGL